MELLLERKFKKSEYTIGRLYIDGRFFCNTMEDTDRGLTQTTPLDEIRSNPYQPRKTFNEDSAIPTGYYKITLDVVSPKYSKRQQYKAIDGKLPRLLDVPGFEGILIHIGNTASDSAGCILVGHNKVRGQVVNSTSTFNELYSLLLDRKRKGEEIFIKIV